METAGSPWSPARNTAPARAGRMLFVATVRYRGDGWVAQGAHTSSRPLHLQGAAWSSSQDNLCSPPHLLVTP